MLVPLTEQLRNEHKVRDTVKGLFVREVKPDSPYANQLRPGMTVVDINGIPVESEATIGELINLQDVNVFRVHFQGRFSYIPIVVE